MTIYIEHGRKGSRNVGSLQKGASPKLHLRLNQEEKDAIGAVARALGISMAQAAGIAIRAVSRRPSMLLKIVHRDIRKQQRKSGGRNVRPDGIP